MMTEQVVAVACDVPGCTTTASTPGGTLPQGWFGGTLTLSGYLYALDACPRCMGDLLDPPDDIAAEVRRFQREDRIA